MSSHAPLKQETQNTAAANSSLRAELSPTALHSQDAGQAVVPRDELQQRLNQSPQVQSQLQTQRALNQSPRVVAQAKLAQTLSERQSTTQSKLHSPVAADDYENEKEPASTLHAVSSAPPPANPSQPVSQLKPSPTASPAPRGKGSATGVIQRVPVNTGETLKFYDDEIPALLTLTGFLLREGLQFAKYKVDATGTEFYFNKATGVYLNLNLEPIDPRTLAPEEMATIGFGPDNGPPPGGEGLESSEESIKFLKLSFDESEVSPVLEFARQHGIQLPTVVPLPEPIAPVPILQRMIYKIIVPNLMQLVAQLEHSVEHLSPLEALLVSTIRKSLPRLLVRPFQNGQLLQLLFDTLLKLSDYLVENMPVQTPGELSYLAYTDITENKVAMSMSSYKQAQNELGGKVDDSKIPAEERMGILEKAYHVGFNFAGYLKRYKITFKNMTRGQQVDAAITEIANTTQQRIERYISKKDLGIFALMGKLGLTPDNFRILLTTMTGLGWTLEEINSLLSRLIQGKKLFKEPKTLQAELAFLLQAHLEENVPRPINVDPSSFGSTGEEFETGVIDPMLLGSVERSKKKGHTLGVNAYIERHFTPSVMKFLASHPSMFIQIYEGQVSKAVGDLALQGYTEILSLSGNPATDFRKFIARNPESGDSIFVVVGLSGVSYQREIAAHFLYYNPPINPLRIIHRRLRMVDPTRVEFEETLQSLGLIPDIVQMGNVEQVERILKEKARITPIRTIAAPNLFGKVYNINGRIMISLRVEPQLYADRAGAFLRAVQKLNPGHITVIFTGTAGALNKDLKIGDLVAPELLQQADVLEPSPVAITNLAAAYLKRYFGGREKEGMITGEMIRHGAVDTILFEDQVWFDIYQNTLTIVEQEVAHLAKAALMAGNRTHLYALFKISDVLGVQDFTANETERPEYRTPVLQGDLVLDILEKLPPHEGVKLQFIMREAALQLKAQKNALILKFARKIITISKDIFDLLENLDPEFTSSFVEQLNRVIETVKEGDLKGLVTQFSRLFQFYNLAVSNISVANPVTQVQFKYTDNARLVLWVRTSQGIKVYQLNPSRRAGFYACDFETVGEDEAAPYAIIELAEGGKTRTLKEGVLTGGVMNILSPTGESSESKKPESKTKSKKDPNKK